MCCTHLSICSVQFLNVVGPNDPLFMGLCNQPRPSVVVTQVQPVSLEWYTDTRMGGGGQRSKVILHHLLQHNSYRV